MLMCSILLQLSHMRPRVRRAPGLPCALYFRGPTKCKTSGASRREINLRCHRPRRRTIQYSEIVMIELRSRGVLDPPAFAGDDDCRELRSPDERSDIRDPPHTAPDIASLIRATS